jgi:hypothetical protein
VVAVAVAWIGGPGALVGVLLGLNGPVAVHGEIVDAETQEPLEGVVLSIRETRFDLFGRDLASTREWRETASGRFSVSCVLCAGLRIAFRKPGHHAELVEALYAAEGGDLRDGRRQVALRSSAHAVPDLVRVSGQLAVGRETEEVLPLGGGSVRHGVPRSLVATLHDAAAEGVEETPAWLALHVERGPDGNVREEVVSRPGGGTGFPKPVAPRLVVEGADGGFVPYRPRARRFRDIELEMREAPATGYVRELPLDVVTDGTSWFFVRVGDRFGRGSYNPPLIERGSTGRRAAVAASVVLNPRPGSRNLESLR